MTHLYEFLYFSAGTTIWKTRELSDITNSPEVLYYPGVHMRSNFASRVLVMFTAAYVGSRVVRRIVNRVKRVRSSPILVGFSDTSTAKASDIREELKRRAQVLLDHLRDKFPALGATSLLLARFEPDAIVEGTDNETIDKGKIVRILFRRNHGRERWSDVQQHGTKKSSRTSRT